MDPITVALMAAIGALSSGTLQGVTEAGKNAIVDSYNGLKALIKQKYGDNGSLAQAVEETERDKDAPGQAQILAGTVARTGADKDQDLLQAAQALQRAIEAQPGGSQYVQTVHGNLNAVVQGGGTATVYSSGSPPPEASQPS
jgi:hypothetical protein